MATEPRTPHEPLYDLSGDWRAVCQALHVAPDIDPDPDRLAAATRTNQPLHYRRKHAPGGVLLR